MTESGCNGSAVARAMDRSSLKRVAIGAVIAVTWLDWTSSACAQPAPPTAGGPTGAFRAYLPADALTPGQITEPPPAAGSARQRYDQAIFRETRGAANSPQWDLAIHDSGKGILRAFSCSAGLVLEDQVPALVRLLSRLRTDAINATHPPVGETPYPVPPAGLDGAICVQPKSGATASTEYPSLQSLWGWSVALLMAEALPEHADALYQRGRAYGDSAVICGTAWASAVEDGRVAAGALLARLRASPEFPVDYAAAKEELAALARATPDAPQDCAKEKLAVAATRY